MAASQASLELRNNTDANFRLWGSFISNGLAAGGWTLEDTDINWTTVTAPAQNTYAGYEIWKSPDEAGLTNFYLKLRYGSNNNATIGLMVEFQIGWEWTSGSSLSGVVGTAVSNVNTVAANSTARLCTIAANAGELVINMGNVAAAIGSMPHAFLLAIWRNRDAANAKMDEISLFFNYGSGASPSNTVAFKVLGTDAESVTETSTTAYVILPNTTNFASKGKIGLAYVQAYRGGRRSPCDVVVAVPVNSAGVAGEQVQIELYGETRTFIVAGVPVGSTSVGSLGAVSTIQTLYLYE